MIFERAFENIFERTIERAFERAFEYFSNFLKGKREECSTRKGKRERGASVEFQAEPGPVTFSIAQLRTHARTNETKRFPGWRECWEHSPPQPPILPNGACNGIKLILYTWQSFNTCAELSGISVNLIRNS